MTRALDRLRRKLTVENLWIYIIKAIIDEGHPMRAYSIKKKIAEKYGVRPSTITVYTVIYRMAGEGLLARTSGDGDVLYTVTEKGLRTYYEGIEFIREILERLGEKTLSTHGPGVHQG